MKNNIIVNILLAFVFLLILLHQWIGWKAEGHEAIKNKSRLFDKKKCLKQLNADRNMKTHPDIPCHKLYLNDFDLRGEPIAGQPSESFDFCIPPFTNYTTVEMVSACGLDGFWTRDQKGCIQTFTPGTDEEVLKEFMKAVGFAQFVHFDKVPWGISLKDGFVFFSDACMLDKKRRKLKCGLDIYHLSPQLVPHPLYVKGFGCSVD